MWFFKTFIKRKECIYVVYVSGTSGCACSLPLQQEAPSGREDDWLWTGTDEHLTHVRVLYFI
jgi:hypothetical protein